MRVGSGVHADCMCHFHCAYGGSMFPVRSTYCATPWSVFRDGVHERQMHAE